MGVRSHSINPAASVGEAVTTEPSRRSIAAEAYFPILNGFPPRDRRRRPLDQNVRVACSLDAEALQGVNAAVPP
jgi:hypothetical protein